MMELKNMTYNKAIKALQSLLLWLLSVSFFGVGVWLAIEDKTASASSCFGVGIFMFFLAKIDRFTSINAFGLKAKTRKLEEKLDDADKLLVELKRLSLLSGTYIIDSASRQGRWDSSLDSSHLYEIKEQICKQLKDIGVEKKDIGKATESWERWSAVDIRTNMVNEIRNGVSKLALEAPVGGMQYVEKFDKTLMDLYQVEPQVLRRETIRVLGSFDAEEAVGVAIVDIDAIRIRALAWLDELDYLVNNHNLPKNSLLLSNLD
jgi:hypothetical protein